MRSSGSRVGPYSRRTVIIRRLDRSTSPVCYVFMKSINSMGFGTSVSLNGGSIPPYDAMLLVNICQAKAKLALALPKLSCILMAWINAILQLWVAL